MTVTKRSPNASSEHRVRLGSYDRDGTTHEIIASRPRGRPWRLTDVAGDSVTLIEAFAPDEGEEAVQAVADMYLAERRA